MASQFAGLHMRVVLRDPPGHQLTGTVRDVQAGSSLTLTNGKRVYFFAPPLQDLGMNMDKTNPTNKSLLLQREHGSLICESMPPTLRISQKSIVTTGQIRTLCLLRNLRPQRTPCSSHRVSRLHRLRLSRPRLPLSIQLS